MKSKAKSWQEGYKNPTSELRSSGIAFYGVMMSYGYAI